MCVEELNGFVFALYSGAAVCVLIHSSCAISGTVKLRESAALAGRCEVGATARTTRSLGGIAQADHLSPAGVTVHKQLTSRSRRGAIAPDPSERIVGRRLPSKEGVYMRASRKVRPPSLRKSRSASDGAMAAARW